MTYCLMCYIIDFVTKTNYRGMEQLVARRAHNPKVAGSSPAPATNAGVAQSVERILGKDKVTGSIPVTSSILIWRRSSVG